MNEMLHKVLDELRSSLRFRWYGIGLAWFLCLLGWGVVAWMPNVYEASARVYIDTSSVLAPVLGDQIVTPNVEAQLAYVRESLLGDERLDIVARTTGLDAGALSPRDHEAVLTRLGNQIRITTEATISQGNIRTDNIYTISYRNEDRDMAIAVVRALYDAMIEDTLAAQTSGTDTREAFVVQRLADLEAQLHQDDQNIAAYKRENADRLPGTEGDYFTRMQIEKDELADLQSEMRVLEARRRQLTQQLNAEPLVVTDASNQNLELRPDSIDAKIRDATIRLDALLLEFTDIYPDVIAQRQVLEQYQAQRAAQLEAMGVSGVNQEISAFGINRVHEEVRIALNQAEVDIATLAEDIALSQARVNELQAVIGEVPAIEAELARMTRDYDVKMDAYLALARSRETVRLSQQASITDQVDFRPVKLPDAPFAPVAPARPLLLVAVFLGSLGAGGILCFLLSQIYPVFSSVKQLQDRLALPVIGVVTQAWEARYRVQFRKAALAYGGALAGLFIVFGGVAAIEIVGPGVHSLFGAVAP